MLEREVRIPQRSSLGSNVESAIRRTAAGERTERATSPTQVPMSKSFCSYGRDLVCCFNYF